MQLLSHETIPSFMARTKLLVIHKRNESFYQSIIGCSYTQTCGSVTYRLDRLASLLGINIRQLICDHTTYPYFSRFMTEAQANSLYSAMRDEKHVALESLTGSVTSRLGIPNYHALCPLCAEQDVREYGTAYWHVHHSLPCVRACHLHGCKLARFPTKAKHLTTPDLRGISIEQASSKETFFAQLSAYFTFSSHEGYSPEEYTDLYRDKLSAYGYTTKTGSIRAEKLLSDIRRFWGSLLHHKDYQHLRCDGKQHNFVRDILRSPTKRTHPVKHILLSGFLDELKVFPNRTAMTYNRITPTSTEADKEKAIALLTQGVSLSKASQLTGVSYYTVRKLAAINQVSSQTKPRKLTVESKKKAIELLKTGLSMKKVGIQFGLSESGIDNLLNEHPEIRALRKKLREAKRSNYQPRYRQAALEIINSNQGLVRKELCALNPKAFCWLRKHDTDWLEQKLPTPKTPKEAQAQRYKHQKDHWRSKQARAIHNLRQFAQKTLASPPLQQRVSITYILKVLEVRNVQRHIRSTMPAFWYQVSRFAESHEDFQLRKLHTLYKNDPMIFSIYSARRLLKIAAAYPPVTDKVLEQASLLQKKDIDYKREKLKGWLLLRNTKSVLSTSFFTVQQPNLPRTRRLTLTSIPIEVTQYFR